MADSPSIAKFWNRNTVPPRNGWHFTVGGQQITRYSENEILQELRQWRKNNGTYVSDAALEKEIWDYYCSREPERCGTATVANRSTATVTLVHKELSKEEIGRILWRHLNLFAASWTPQLKGLFVQNVDVMLLLLSCPVCQNEWRQVVRDNPPHSISSRFQACQWAWNVHDQVNLRLGKTRYSYQQAAAEYGFPLSES